MRVEHYAPKALTLDMARITPQQPDMKPKGFWFTPEGAEDSWKDFCEAEHFALDRFEVKIINEIDTTNILVITTPEGIDEFAAKYQWKEESVFAARDLFPGADRIYTIDWEKVAKEYKGIVISPYQWSRRLGKHLWYYGWDCASGCIWDMSAVKEGS